MHEKSLKSITGMPWTEFGPHKVYMYNKCTNFDTACVATYVVDNNFNEWEVVQAQDFYIPSKAQFDLDNPKHFYKKYLLPVRRNIAKVIPAIKFDFDEFADSKPLVFFKTLPLYGEGMVEVKITLQLTGSLMLKEKESQVTSVTVGKDGLEFGYDLNGNRIDKIKEDFIKSLTTINCNFVKPRKLFSIGSKAILCENLEVTLAVTSALTLEGELATTFCDMTFGNWEAQGELGYKVDAEVIPGKNKENERMEPVELPYAIQKNKFSNIQTQAQVTGAGISILSVVIVVLRFAPLLVL